MITFNKVEMEFIPGSVEETIKKASLDQRFSHLAGKELLVVKNDRAVSKQERASTMVSDGDVLSAIEVFFGG